MVTFAIHHRGLSERHACRLLEIGRSVYRYQAKRPDDDEIVAELRGLAERKPP